MAARDLYHAQVKTALVKDGWTITHDPLHLVYGKRDMFIDLGAERVLGAEKGNQKIAVETKSFIGKSDLDDLEKALGQFALYEDVLQKTEPKRTLYLAVRKAIAITLFEEPIGQLVLENKRLRFLSFDPRKKEIVRWYP